MQIIGVGSSVLGDMASRPNWGKDELDFVFATLVVSMLVNQGLTTCSEFGFNLGWMNSG